MNDLNALEMLVSYQEIELRVRFDNQAQLVRWKTSIMQALGKMGSGTTNTSNVAQ